MTHSYEPLTTRLTKVEVIKSFYCSTYTFIAYFDCKWTSCFYIQNQLASRYKTGVCQISTAETKILLVLCYYAFFGMMVLMSFTVQSDNKKNLIPAIQQYFVCETGKSGMECDSSSFNEFTNRGLVVMVYFLFGFIPAANLMFVINWTVANKLFKHIWMRYPRKSYTISNIQKIDV